MKKGDLKNGDIVLTRDGVKHIVLKDTKCYVDKKDLLVDLTSSRYLSLNDYDDNLLIHGDEDFDVMKVCSMQYVGDNIKNHIINSEDIWTWERQETKEMTLAEISEALGYDVKVIKEVEND